MESEDIRAQMAAIEALGNATALMDHEVQKAIVLLQQCPNEEALKFIFETCGEGLPQFVERAEEYGVVGIAFRSFNEALMRFHREVAPLFVAPPEAPEEGPPPPEGQDTPPELDASLSALADGTEPE